MRCAWNVARRLVGLGTGLTPSGDDFLVGFASRLGDNAARRRVRERLAAAPMADLARTNVISAHQLRLAASGQFNDDLLRARDALVSSRSRLRSALAPLLRTGASSGAAAWRSGFLRRRADRATAMSAPGLSPPPSANYPRSAKRGG